MRSETYKLTSVPSILPLVNQIVEVGRNGREVIPPALNVQEGWFILRSVRIPAWPNVAETLNESDLENLIRGFVLMSRVDINYSGGSASIVIALYRIFVRRFPENEPPLTEWIVTNRVNNYDPFGSRNNFGAKSLKEYELRSAVYSARIKLKAAENNLSQYESSILKRAKDKEQATQRLSSAVRRGDLKAVISILGRGADPNGALPKGESLVELAQKNKRNDVEAFLISKGII